MLSHCYICNIVLGLDKDYTLETYDTNGYPVFICDGCGWSSEDELYSDRPGNEWDYDF